MGKIVVLEGTDFSGKTTQYEKLKDRLSSEGITFGTDSFPNYGEPSCYFVETYLRGGFGEDATAIEPKLASTFYTLDRFASYNMRDWGKIYREGGNVLFARYISSNILHQASKYESWEEKKAFIDWLYDYECGLFGLPKDDCVILLNMPPQVAQELKARRLQEQNGLSSNGSEKDIHESNAEYLRKSYDTALQVADYLGWKVISCVNEQGELKSIDEIHNEIYEIVSQIFEK